jgi:predicted component of type VI protein secretion system
MTRAETDFFLNKWITQYVTSPTDNQEIKAKKPLSEARIDVM